MQPQNVSAFTRTYIDDGDDTPYASDRFDDIPDRLVNPTNSFSVTAPGDATTDKIELELQQLVDCQSGNPPSGTCPTTSMTSTQNVKLDSQLASLTNPNSIDFEADLFMLQKADSAGQSNNVDRNTGTHTVNAKTEAGGQIDVSHDGNDNELQFNMWQYNKRGAIDSEDRIGNFEIDVVGAIEDEDGGGNDDASSKNTATQSFDADARGTSVIQAATETPSGAERDLEFTVAQFNAGCDDTDTSPPAAIDIFCDNVANQLIELDSRNSAVLTFNTPNPVEFQQINTCTFSKSLRCLNDGTLDIGGTPLNIGVLAEGSGEANVEVGGPNGEPALFQENTCSNLNAGTVSNPNDCANVSNNEFNVQKSGASNIGSTDLEDLHQASLELDVAQANDCDSATARIDCVNTGRVSNVDLPNLGPTTGNRDIGGEFGTSTTIMTVNAVGGGTNIEDANTESSLTMVNDCDGARLSGTQTATCTNLALNEAHFLAGRDDTTNGADLDVDRVVQDSQLINSCDNLEATSTLANADFCTNRATNSFTAISTDGANINLNSGVTQTAILENDCFDAKCLNDALNLISLNADNGAEIQTTSGSEGVTQSIDLLNDCSGEARCTNLAENDFSIVASGQGSDVDLSQVNSQEITLINDCHTAITCLNDYNNEYHIVNTSGETLTVSADQDIFRLNTGGSFTQDNTINIFKTGSFSDDGAYSFIGSQTSNNDPTPFTQNTYNAPNPSSGSCTYSQTNGGAQSFTGQTGTGCS